MKKTDLKLIIFLALISFVFLLIHVRFCPIYNIFKIPCVGCGITRSVYHLMHLDIITSLKYNPMGLVIVLVIFIEIISRLFKIKNPINSIIYANKKVTISVSIILYILLWIHNINNPLLYS